MSDSYLSLFFLFSGICFLLYKDRYQSRKLRRTAARMKLYQKKYGTPLPEEFYDVTPPSLVEALDKEMAEQIRKKLRSKIMSQIRLQQLSTRSSEDDHLPLLDKCDKPNCRKKVDPISLHR